MKINSKKYYTHWIAERKCFFFFFCQLIRTSLKHRPLDHRVCIDQRARFSQPIQNHSYTSCITKTTNPRMLCLFFGKSNRTWCLSNGTLLLFSFLVLLLQLGKILDQKFKSEGCKKTRGIQCVFTFHLFYWASYWVLWAVLVAYSML